MGCCGSNSKKPENLNNGSENNNRRDSVERNDASKTKTVLTWVIVIILIVGFLIWMI